MECLVKKWVFDALGVPLFSAVGRCGCFVQAHAVPVSVVPPNLVLGTYLTSAFLHHLRHFFESFEALRLIKCISDVSVLLEPHIQEGEHVLADSLELGLARVALIHFEVL